MAFSDALYVVDDWISEHYFISDDKSGTFAARAKDLLDAWRKESSEDPAQTNPRERFTARNADLISRLLDLQADAAEMTAKTSAHERRQRLGDRSIQLADLLRWMLGYTDENGLAAQWDVTEHGPLRLFATRGVDETPFAMLDALAADDLEDILSKRAGHLPADVVLGEGTDAERTLTSVPQVLSALALETTPPEFMLVLAGRYAVLTSADLWPQGRYLVADLQTIAERNDLKRGGEVERMLACLSADSLAPDPSSQIWWTTTREQAVANAVGVSEDLRDGVRESIEIIANEVLRRRRKSRELGELPEGEAQELAIQSLRYLYRILFLLYAEASPELRVLPTGAPEFEQGYSVGRLRELVEQDVPLESADGTYFYDSLGKLFHLVNNGNGAAATTKRAEADAPAEHGDGTLRFENLEADLFDPDGTKYINDAGLGNAALKAVLERLLLSKEKRGKARGAISYVALGINQLGAVYESLMSYTGSIATEELVEVAKNGNPEGGSWVVPADTLDESLLAHRVMVSGEDGEPVPRTYRHGEFVFRLSGRERQQSASYYSPEVITKFTVSQGLAELLDPVIEDETDLPEGVEVFPDTDFDRQPIRRRRTTAAEILAMSICEPALGSGAFAIEAVRQLADEYLSRRQKELDKQIDPEAYTTELQRVKAYIALHNVYGVDLNATAVELAEVSLWLDTMAPGLKAPWFGLRLRAGNSLIGARHATYSSAALGKAKLKDIVSTAPAPLPVSTVHEEFSSTSSRRSLYGKIFHFLLPGEGWFASAQDAEIKKLAPDEAKSLRDHAKLFHGKLSADELKRLRLLTQRAEELWGFALRRLELAEENTRRAIPVWEADTPEGGAVTRAEIQQSLDDENSSYRRLRLAMDAWCALWFWPVLPDDEVKPPTFTQWLDTLEKILGKTLEVVADKRGSTLHKAGQMIMGSAGGWNELNVIESLFSVNGASSIKDLVAETPWLKRCVAIAERQKFFHWELDFAAAFDRGGFDLQVGNPPWVRPDLDVAALLGEFDPWWVLANKPSNAAKSSRREQTLALDGARRAILTGSCDVAGTAEFVGSDAMYPAMRGTRPDLYRNFMERTWAHAAPAGITSLVHPPTHLTDAKGYALRLATYGRLRRHWRIVNELQLFAEVDHHTVYSVNVYGARRAVDFLSAVAIFHPSVVEGSLRHDGSGPEPGFKNTEGAWDISPHRARIQRNRRKQLELWHALMESGDVDVPVESSRMLSSVNHAASAVLETLSKVSNVGSLAPRYSTGWNETTDRAKGRFESHWGAPESWNNVILQGPYFHVGNPFASERNESMSSNLDYSALDLEALTRSAIPATEYKPLYGGRQGANGEIISDSSGYDAAYGSWTYEVDRKGKAVLEETPVRDHYRVLWRAMAATTGERTLIPAIYPPGAAHVFTAYCFGFPGRGKSELVRVAASLSTLVADFLMRSSVSNHILGQSAARAPIVPLEHPLLAPIMLRTLRLNSLTTAYADLWSDAYDPSFTSDAWTGGLERPNRPALGDVGPEWSMASPLRIDEDRRQALVEIDAIMAIVTGISIDDLVTIYRTQFGVLNDYDRGEGKKAYIFDANGRQIPSAVRTAWKKADRPETGLPLEDRTAVHPSATGEGRTIVYELPFRILNREADMRQAYAEFTRRMEENPS
ncbi:MAG: restriction endonuclease [Brachybacterium sp.]|uniref:restriction endonuclease n=1 Tax=Brachybacterium sp. TaxID=1891286 RepID=UPI00324238C9